MFALRSRGPACAACDSPYGTLHAANCRTRVMTARLPSSLVMIDDTTAAACGCPLALVRQFGDVGHRSDCGRPELARPAVLLPREVVTVVLLAAIVVCLLFIGVNLWRAAWLAEFLRSYAYALLAAGTALATGVISLVTGLYLRTPRHWHGQRMFVAGEPYRVQRCVHCVGSGLQQLPAYPPLPRVQSPIRYGGPGWHTGTTTSPRTDTR